MTDGDPTPDPDSPALRPARMHEAEGAGRRVFALYQALRHPGPLFWVLPGRDPGLPFLWGLPPGVADRLYVVHALAEADLLWAVEEILRAPAVGLVVAEPQAPLSLTAGRRLQLAAKAGQTTAILLIGQGHGSNAAETRWHCRPLLSPAGEVRHDWRRVRDKRGTPLAWTVAWDGRAPELAILSRSVDAAVSAPAG